ncbi:MAG: hypothetical protein EBS49_04655 [Verrucomicrobia bacterium]|nr:hypothetical protein [Verrucomicrobiota bacterium]
MGLTLPIFHPSEPATVALRYRVTNPHAKAVNPDVPFRRDGRVKAGRRLPARSPNICPPGLIDPLSQERGKPSSQK